MSFQVRKLYDGFSTCFRQWGASGTHCRFLHGYGVSFEIFFEGPLDFRNWVIDFGFAKRSETILLEKGMNLDQYFKWLFDHTVVIAADDPEIETFLKLHDAGIIQLRTMEKVGCEMFAKHIFEVASSVVKAETDGRTKIIEVRFYEHERNSASYRP